MTLKDAPPLVSLEDTLILMPDTKPFGIGGFAIDYSGDTEWTDNLTPAAAGADLFISEAYFYDKPVPFHIDYTTLAQHRSHLGCKRLIVTHMGPDMLAHVAGLPVEAAYDGMEVSL